jgi:hypothetical protein
LPGRNAWTKTEDILIALNILIKELNTILNRGFE